MKRIIIIALLFIASSCAIKKPSETSNYKSGVVYRIIGNDGSKAIYICLENTRCIKVCNYTGSKTINDSIGICYRITNYQNEFLYEE